MNDGTKKYWQVSAPILSRIVFGLVRVFDSSRLRDRTGDIQTKKNSADNFESNDSANFWSNNKTEEQKKATNAILILNDLVEWKEANIKDFDFD